MPATVVSKAVDVAVAVVVVVVDDDDAIAVVEDAVAVDEIGVSVVSGTVDTVGVGNGDVEVKVGGGQSGDTKQAFDILKTRPSSQFRSKIVVPSLNCQAMSV